MVSYFSEKQYDVLKDLSEVPQRKNMSFEELKKAPKEEVVISIPTVTKNLLPNKFFRVSVRIAILLQGFNYKLGIRKYHNSTKLSVRKYLRIRSEEA